MANEIYDSTWWGNTIQTASSIGTSTEMIQGQFNLTKLGDELVTNGDFATDSDWTKGSGWSISGGSANTDGTPSSEIRQNNVTIVGKQYKYSFTISNSGGGVFSARFRNKSTGVPILNFSSEGTYSGTFTSNGTFIDFVTLSNNTASFSIDNVSVKEARAEKVEAVKCLADAIHRIGIQDIQN